MTKPRSLVDEKFHSDEKRVKPVSLGATRADWLPVKNDSSLGVFFCQSKLAGRFLGLHCTDWPSSIFLSFTGVPGKTVISEKDKMLNRSNNFYIGRAQLNAKWREFWKFQIVKIKNTNWTIDGCNKCTPFQFKKFYLEYWNVEQTLEIIITMCNGSKLETIPCRFL